jgi:hypothetical protein
MPRYDMAALAQTIEPRWATVSPMIEDRRLSILPSPLQPLQAAALSRVFVCSIASLQQWETLM